MSEALQQFHFLRPWWLLALVALPLLVLIATRRQGAREQLSRLVDPELLPFLLKGTTVRRRASPWLLAGGWLLVTLAMAGPTWSRVAQPLYAKRAAQVVAVSMSQRMLARDVTPSRLDRARYKVRDLFAVNHDGLNALIAYAGEAFAVAPLTTDASALNDLLDALAPDTMPVDGDNAAQAIERGTALIRDAKVGGGSLVLVTDDAGDAAQAAARKAAADGVRVSVLGMGTAQGGPVPLSDQGFQRDEHGDMLLARRNDSALRALAASGGGQYVPMTDDNRDIQALATELATHGEAEPAADLHSDEWQDRGPWLLLLLLPLAAVSFRRGWLMLLALALLPAWPGPARASSWSDLWHRPDQQAATALQQGDAKRAQQLAKDPAWRGAAAYRAGDYATAGKDLRSLPGSDAQYNLGNALAKQGDYQGALDAYDRALKVDPHNADAQANRKAVEDWMHRQQKNPQNDNGAKDNKGKAGPGPTTTPPDNAQGQSGQPQREDGKQDQGQGKPSQDGKDGAQGNGKPQGEQGGNQPMDRSPDQGGATPPQTPEQQAEQRARQEQAQQALQKQMDAALGQQARDKPQNGAHELGAIEKDDPQAKLPADVRQALQRVPDDPGALLRRKFELEYRQRHGGAGPSEGDSP
ncbi:tetratricopeptide repeat protein [Dyella telluris]|uniref:Tetratricopeptide repeat protein n=1 Tax=Dyella telluris TaxID=2763498 RepID=A0A7G8PZP8_9GAMM|nr:tetratricopeptide repeat protein [Dyella telluris]QNK00006.1 tetratricopeptide repeat protein [Dyella telluris]